MSPNWSLDVLEIARAKTHLPLRAGRREKIVVRLSKTEIIGFEIAPLRKVFEFPVFINNRRLIVRISEPEPSGHIDKNAIEPAGGKFGRV